MAGGLGHSPFSHFLRDGLRGPPPDGEALVPGRHGRGQVPVARHPPVGGNPRGKVGAKGKPLASLHLLQRTRTAQVR